MSLLSRMPLEVKHAGRRVAATPFHRDLDRLAAIYRTDQGRAGHGYTRLYSRHLPRRSWVRSLLEIGVGGTTSVAGYETSSGGASLRMWRDYFPRATVVGIDIHHKNVHGSRIQFEQGSQDDPAFLRSVCERHGPFDVVIDDGSHIGRHQIASFQTIFPALRAGGVYVVEDLETAYREDYEGGLPGTPETATHLLKQTIDAVLRSHWDSGITADPVSELHIYDQIAFLVKAM